MRLEWPSATQAGKVGADFVEFDVQLTKDRVPVLYHDFFLNVGLEDKAEGAGAEEFETGIHELTLRQLTRSKTLPVSKKAFKLQSTAKKHWPAILGHLKNESASTASSSKRKFEVTATTAADADSGEHLVDFFPKLRDLLAHVPHDVGLNVEIKYPNPRKTERRSLRFSDAFEMNAYVDAILKCVFDHAGASRRLFFSCFDPNICVLLRAKQATYPVLFLTYGFVFPVPDARLTLQFATRFVQMERLNGIVSNSDTFLKHPELVRYVRDAQGIVLMTWGDKNTDHACVQRQKKHGMDAVISDNIGDLVRKDTQLLLLKK